MHRLASVWIKAMIAVDQQNSEAANMEFDRLIAMDPIIDTRDQARMEAAFAIFARQVALASLHDVLGRDTNVDTVVQNTRPSQGK